MAKLARCDQDVCADVNAGPVEQHEYSRVIMMIVPGGDDIQLYQPTHKLAYDL
jgi:hypothetical protein